MSFSREQMDGPEHSRLIKAGQKRALARGVRSGPPRALSFPGRQLIREAVGDGRLTVSTAAQRFAISKSTVRRILKERF